MYTIITVYGRNEEYIRTRPARVFRFPNTSETSHLNCPDCLDRNSDDMLLRIRVQLGQDKCTWRVGGMNEEAMEYFRFTAFHDGFFTNIRAPIGQSMILFFVQELDNLIARYNIDTANSTLPSQIPQVR